KAEREALPVAGNGTAGLVSALAGEVVKHSASAPEEVRQSLAGLAGVVAQVLTLPPLFDSGEGNRTALRPGRPTGQQCQHCQKLAHATLRREWPPTSPLPYDGGYRLRYRFEEAETQNFLFISMC